MVADQVAQLLLLIQAALQRFLILEPPLLHLELLDMRLAVAPKPLIIQVLVLLVFQVVAVVVVAVQREI
jgi:hypothetical protein